MQPVQIKMARAALGLSVEDLAKGAGISTESVIAIEKSGSVVSDDHQSLALFLASHGIEFIDADGVRAKANGTDEFIPVEQLTTENDGGEG